MPPVRKLRMDALGASILIVFNILLGLNQALIKLVNAGFAPMFQVGLRSLCAFVLVLGFVLYKKKDLSLSDGTLLPGLYSGLLFSLEFCLLFIALDYTSVARVSVLFYTMPVWIALGAHFWIPEEKLTTARVLALLLAVVGIGVVLMDADRTSSQASLVGDLLSIGAAICWAGTALVVRASKLSRSTPEKQLLYQLFVSALLLLLIAPFFGDTIRDLTPGIVAIFAFQVVVVVSIGFVVWFWILSIYPATDMASYSLLAPIFGVFFGWLIFDDQLSPMLLVALLCVGGGIILINRDSAKRAREH